MRADRGEQQSAAFDAMDRMYRLQRHFYDLTRKYYLLGRDHLLREMDVRPGDRILEIGCGTARNLIILAKRNPEAELCGLDASSEMLETARSKVIAANVGNITLKTALADDFTFDVTFGSDKRFDKIFFSYSISMIPTWKESIENALDNLRPGGKLFMVDFYDQGDLALPFRRLLKWWLAKFQVEHWEGLIPYLESLANSGSYSVSIQPLFRRYSFIAEISGLKSKPDN
jgi:S-adenosylmethionine-diacylgycerolhomoserine-N-methlytransferase